MDILRLTMIKVIKNDERISRETEKKFAFVAILTKSLARDLWYQWIFHGDKNVTEFPFGNIS